MKTFLIILGIIGFIIYGFLLCYKMIIEQSDEYLDESMDRAYEFARALEHKDEK